MLNWLHLVRAISFNRFVLNVSSEKSSLVLLDFPMLKSKQMLKSLAQRREINYFDGIINWLHKTSCMIYKLVLLFYLPRITFSCKIFQKHFALQMNRTVFGGKFEMFTCTVNHFMKQRTAICHRRGSSNAHSWKKKQSEYNCSVETGRLTSICFSFGYTHDGSNAVR